MLDSKHVIPLYNKIGDLHSIMITPEFWQKHQSRLEKLINTLVEEDQPKEIAEPLHEWDDFIKYWDFRYPYNSEVQCGCCNAKTNDWLNDPERPFKLKSAQLGGLAVFACKKCGATVRKKHFKDHYCFEFTPAGIA